jgi:hypothetical protein
MTCQRSGTGRVSPQQRATRLHPFLSRPGSPGPAGEETAEVEVEAGAGVCNMSTWSQETVGKWVQWQLPRRSRRLQQSPHASQTRPFRRSRRHVYIPAYLFALSRFQNTASAECRCLSSISSMSAWSPEMPGAWVRRSRHLQQAPTHPRRGPCHQSRRYLYIPSYCLPFSWVNSIASAECLCLFSISSMSTIPSRHAQGMGATAAAAAQMWSAAKPPRIPDEAPATSMAGTCANHHIACARP